VAEMASKNWDRFNTIKAEKKITLKNIAKI
jgi:hypothetical protein